LMRVEVPPEHATSEPLPRLSYLELLRKKHTAAVKDELGRITFHVPGGEEETRV